MGEAKPTNEQIIRLLEDVLGELRELKAEVAKLTDER